MPKLINGNDLEMFGEIIKALKKETLGELLEERNHLILEQMDLNLYSHVLARMKS